MNSRQPRGTRLRSMLRRLGAVLAIALGSTYALTALAQGGFPVIVVLDGQAALGEFASRFRTDVRAATAPDAWNYLRPEVAGAVQALERRHGFVADHVYTHALRGFAARLTARQILDLETDPLVAYVEADGIMEASKPPGGAPGGGGGGGRGGGGGDLPPQVVPWGIDRVDADSASTLAGDGTGGTGGVAVYVIDTGIDASHPDLNVAGAVNFAGGKNADCNGHGTHVAGTIAAIDNPREVVGVAPGAALYAVKVLGCSGSGTVSGVIKGIDWVTAQAQKPGAQPAVANMSLGGGASSALDDAVRASVSAGVFYALAAGNESTDACTRSPARVGGTTAGAMTVGATDSGNQVAGFSNTGSCVDIWSPGVGILSTRMGGGTTTLSGTSMASPHTAGAAALHRSLWGARTPAAVESDIRNAAVQFPLSQGLSVPITNVGLW